jgi:hypothetical protein
VVDESARGPKENERLAAVRRYDILDTPPDGAFARRRSGEGRSTGGRGSSPTPARSEPAKPRWARLDQILRCCAEDPEVVQDLREISDRVVHPARQ